MARRTVKYTVQDDGRDFGKVFVLTEMPASQAERWAIRAFMALAKSGIDVPDGMMSSGMAGLAQAGIVMLTAIPFEIAEPLLDEMMTCIQIMPSAQNPSVVRPLIEDDIEEIQTRMKLRMEVVKLHLNFSQAGNA